MDSDKAPDILSTVPPDQTVAIIIPLYGYWKDLANSELNLDVLKYTLSRATSFHNKIYFLFPCEAPRLDNEVKNYLVGKQLAGNAVGVEVEPFATYADYVNEGIEFALEETDARFLIVMNPWIAVREGGLDRMLNLLNRADVSACSGYDMRKKNLPDTELDTYEFNPPQDTVGFDINFFGITRPVADMMRFDIGYRSTAFLSRDFYEEMRRNGYSLLLTEQIPFYSFPVSWKDLEDPGDFAQDKQKFNEKWRFDPLITEENR